MLQLIVPLGPEQWDEATQEFILPEVKVLQLEHSLVSLAKWESKWCKPFLAKEPKTTEETIDYVKCMTITQNVDPDVYNHLTNENLAAVNAYIEAPMTATTFYEEKGKSNREIITAEIVYYWMIAQNIPMECQKWHLNRLLTLVRVCSNKNAPPKKRSASEIMRRNAALNEARRKQLNSRG